MKANHLTYLLTLLVCFLCISSSEAQKTDSLQLVKDRLHAALNSNENGCYEVKVFVKPMTDRDTSERSGIVKFYPSSMSAPLDSVRNFYYRCGFEPWGHIHHDGTNVWYNSDWKKMSVREWDQNYLIEGWLKRMGFYTYYPLYMKYNIFNKPHVEQEKYFITDDSLYYYAKSYNKEDTMTEVYAVQIGYQPRLHISITRDFIGSDVLMSQYNRYEITEIDCDTIAHVPKALNSDYLSLMPGYSWQPIEEEVEEILKVNEGSEALTWKGLLLSRDTLRSSDIKERFVILDFWYKSCGPCWETIKALSNNQSPLQQEDIYIIGVNPFDWSVKEDAVSVFKRQGGTYQVLFDTDKRMIKDYDISGYPNIFIIDREKNEIIFRQNGHSDDLIEKIEAAIKKAKGS